MDLYFQRHDGQAVTCDDFRAAMADANGVNLDSLGVWYGQVRREGWRESRVGRSPVMGRQSCDGLDGGHVGPEAAVLGAEHLLLPCPRAPPAMTSPGRHAAPARAYGVRRHQPDLHAHVPAAHAAHAGAARQAPRADPHPSGAAGAGW